MDTQTESKLSSLLLRILRFPLTRLLLLGAILFYLYLSGHMFRTAFAKGPMQDLAVAVWMVALTLAVYVGFVQPWNAGQPRNWPFPPWVASSASACCSARVCTLPAY
jgi:fatty acid desaturase